MKKRNGFIRYVFGGEIIEVPISKDKKSIPKSYWGEGDKNWQDAPETKENKADWYQAQDDLDELALKIKADHMLQVRKEKKSPFQTIGFKVLRKTGLLINYQNQCCTSGQGSAQNKKIKHIHCFQMVTKN